MSHPINDNKYPYAPAPITVCASIMALFIISAILVTIWAAFSEVYAGFFSKTIIYDTLHNMALLVGASILFALGVLFDKLDNILLKGRNRR